MAAHVTGHSSRYVPPSKSGGSKVTGHSSRFKPGGSSSGSNSALYDPSQLLSGQQLAQAAQQLTDLQTRGPMSELAAQIARNNQQSQAAQSKTAGYYMQLAKDAQASLGQQQQQAAGLNSTLAGIGSQTQSQLDQFGQQAQSAGSLGTLQSQGLGGGSQQALAAEIARQKGLAAQGSQAFQSAGAVQGGNYTQAGASNLATNALRGQERLGDIARASNLANVPLTQKQATLIANKGALYGSTLGQLRTQERNYSVAQQGLGVKAAGITAATARSANSIAAANQRSANSIAAANQRQLNALAGKPNKAGSSSKPGGRLTQAQQNRLFGQVGTIQALIKDAQGHKLNESQIRQMLQSGANPRRFSFDPALIDAAYALAGYGYLTPKQVHGLHQLGLVIGGRYKLGNPPATSPLAGVIPGAP